MKTLNELFESGGAIYRFGHASEPLKDTRSFTRKQLAEAIRERDEARKDDERGREHNLKLIQQRDSARYDAFTEAELVVLRAATDLCVAGDEQSIITSWQKNVGISQAVASALVRTIAYNLAAALRAARDNKKSENSACNTQRWV
jgi:hypothetical protein